jgi:hypothetical protein
MLFSFAGLEAGTACVSTNSMQGRRRSRRSFKASKRFPVYE